MRRARLSRRTGTTSRRSDIFDFLEVQRDGSVHIDLARASRGRAAAVHDVIVSTPAEGSDDQVLSIELCDKLRALEMLARHLGM